MPPRTCPLHQTTFSFPTVKPVPQYRELSKNSMEHHPNTIPTTKPSPIRTPPLFRLPAELRLEIYTLCLPPPRHFLNISTPRPELEWLATSHTIFHEAAPLLYSQTAIYFDLEPYARSPRRGSIAEAFTSHILSSFPQDSEWISHTIRSSMIKKVMVEVWCAFFDDIGDLLSWLVESATQLGEFEGMGELCFGLRDQCIAPKDAAVLPFQTSILVEGTGTKSRKSAYLREICRLVRRIKAQLPRGCKVRWSLPGETLPEVSFLREGMPEQSPTRKEGLITRFLEDVMLFVDSQSGEEFDVLLVG